ETLPVDLIVSEYRTRLSCGDRPGQHEYLIRFPDQSETLRAELARVDESSVIDATILQSLPETDTNADDVPLPQLPTST
ncbi:hypothetical protein, partial [Streptococcus pneumoniae]|uniref:hypothetical protein n=1 Tax=Streptococcus pneumoniae TaxID=1313 RepID=UPI001E2F7B7A